jgi:hypothetical protein
MENQEHQMKAKIFRSTGYTPSQFQPCSSKFAYLTHVIGIWRQNDKTTDSCIGTLPVYMDDFQRKGTITTSLLVADDFRFACNMMTEEKGILSSNIGREPLPK